MPDGRPAADFDVSYRSLYQAAHRVAYRLLGDREVSSELAHEALLRAYVRWPRIEMHALPWVRRTVTELAIDEDRRPGRRHTNPTSVLSWGSPTTPSRPVRTAAPSGARTCSRRPFSMPRVGLHPHPSEPPPIHAFLVAGRNRLGRRRRSRLVVAAAVVTLVGSLGVGLAWSARSTAAPPEVRPTVTSELSNEPARPDPGSLDQVWHLPAR